MTLAQRGLGMTLLARTTCALGMLLVSVAWVGCSSQPGTTPTPTPVTVTDPSQLAAPPSGTGIQLLTDAFAVPAGEELQVCYFFKVSDLLAASGHGPDHSRSTLHRVQVVQKPGSHHMNLFRVRTIVDLDPANGSPQVGMNGIGAVLRQLELGGLAARSRTRRTRATWTGRTPTASPTSSTRREAHAPDPLRQRRHAADAGRRRARSASTSGRWPQSEVQYQLGTIFATNQYIRICESNPTPTYSASCQINSPSPVTIIGANGHFHSRGKEFDMYAWDGKSTTPPPDVRRASTSRSTGPSPPMLHSPDLDAQVPSNGGVWYTCSYQWQDPSALTNGVDTCEHAQRVRRDEARDAPPRSRTAATRFGGVGRRERALQRVRLLLPEAGQRELLLRRPCRRCSRGARAGGVLAARAEAARRRPGRREPCPVGFLGDEAGAPDFEMQVLRRGRDGGRCSNDGDSVPMILPPQGGRVIFVGVRATNVDGCGLQLTGALRDLATQQVRVDSRTVNLIADGRRLGRERHDRARPSPRPSRTSRTSRCAPTSGRRRTSTAPSTGSRSPSQDRGGRTLTKKIHVTPECGEPDNLAECLCICKAGYVLGESCRRRRAT